MLVEPLNRSRPPHGDPTRREIGNKRLVVRELSRSGARISLTLKSMPSPSMLTTTDANTNQLARTSIDWWNVKKYQMRGLRESGLFQRSTRSGARSAVVADSQILLSRLRIGINQRTS